MPYKVPVSKHSPGQAQIYAYPYTRKHTVFIAKELRTLLARGSGSNQPSVFHPGLIGKASGSVFLLHSWSLNLIVAVLG